MNARHIPKRQLSIHSLVLFIMIVSLLALPACDSKTAGLNQQSVIVQAATTQQAEDLVLKLGGQVTSHLYVINGVGATVPDSALAVMKNAPGVTVSANAHTFLTDVAFEGRAAEKTVVTDYPNVIGADLAWQTGITGQGVTVAVIDTGIDFNPMLGKRADGKKRKLVGWADFISGSKKPIDPNGHGTHIAGIIANADMGADGEWLGVAPGVDLVGVRVLDETGTGSYESVIQGIQWVIQHKAEYNIQVMNLSLHTDVKSPYWADPLNQAVMQAWAAGITVVVSAGNDGPGPMTVTAPGNVPYVITVGAFTDNYTPSDWSDDYITPFSSAGPSLDNFVKPDVIAPGAHMISTMSPKSYIAKQHQANQIDGTYFSMAGTSQAAAVISGVSALVLSSNSSLTPDQVKYRVMFSALPWIDEANSDALYSIWQQGTGRVNALDAINPNLTGSANLGLDVSADLAGGTHYEGYTYFDAESGLFRLRGEYGELLNNGLGAWSGGLGAWSGGLGAWSGSHYGSWADGLGAWSGGLGAWSGGLGAWSGGLGAWSGGLGAWSGGLGAWSGGLGAWSGGYTVWAEGLGAWSGGLGAWSGGLGAWSGGLGAWSGGLGAWSGSTYLEPAYIEVYSSGAAPTTGFSSTLNYWVEEPKP
jgi:serine protease AprX